MRKLKIVTFGCQANELDSARIAGLLARDGYSLTDEDGEADLIILNGKNYYPQDIEHVVSRVDGIRDGQCVAFSRLAPR